MNQQSGNNNSQNKNPNQNRSQRRFRKYHHKRDNRNYQNQGTSQNLTQNKQKDLKHSSSNEQASQADPRNIQANGQKQNIGERRNRNKAFLQKRNHYHSKSSSRYKEADTFNRNRDHAPHHSKNSSSHPHSKGMKRYDYLFDQYLIQRRKYFEAFSGTNKNEKAKAERLYSNALKALRDFERSLLPEERERFEKRYPVLPFDTSYSLAHHLNSTPERVPFSETFEDPHILKTQKECDYSNDTQESVGSMQDYKIYRP